MDKNIVNELNNLVKSNCTIIKQQNEIYKRIKMVKSFVSNLVLKNMVMMKH